MDLNKDLMKDRPGKLKNKEDNEIKQRFRILLREGVEVATRNGHSMRIENVKLEDTHMWANLVCKLCGGILYLDVDRKWHKDRVFGMAAVVNCKKKEDLMLPY